MAVHDGLDFLRGQERRDTQPGVGVIEMEAQSDPERGRLPSLRLAMGSPLGCRFQFLVKSFIELEEPRIAGGAVRGRHMDLDRLKRVCRCAGASSGMALTALAIAGHRLATSPAVRQLQRFRRRACLGRCQDPSGLLLRSRPEEAAGGVQTLAKGQRRIGCQELAHQRRRGRAQGLGHGVGIIESFELQKQQGPLPDHPGLGGGGPQSVQGLQGRVELSAPQQVS